MRHLGVWGFALLHALVACSNSSSSTPADGGTGASSGTGGAATGGASGASSGGASGASSGGASGASSGGASGASSGGASGSSTGGSSGAATGGRSSGGSTSTGGTTDAGVKDAMGEPGDAHTDSCSACKRGELCVEHITEGGAFIPVDAGRCPKGRIPESLGPGRPSDCVYAPSYECRSLPAECSTAPGSTAVAHCTCARSFCDTSDQCTDVSPTLMKCALLAP